MGKRKRVFTKPKPTSELGAKSDYMPDFLKKESGLYQYMLIRLLGHPQTRQCVSWPATWKPVKLDVRKECLSNLGYYERSEVYDCDDPCGNQTTYTVESKFYQTFDADKFCSICHKQYLVPVWVCDVRTYLHNPYCVEEDDPNYADKVEQTNQGDTACAYHFFVNDKNGSGFQLTFFNEEFETYTNNEWERKKKKLDRQQETKQG